MINYTILVIFLYGKLSTGLLPYGQCNLLDNLYIMSCRQTNIYVALAESGILFISRASELMQSTCDAMRHFVDWLANAG